MLSIMAHFLSSKSEYTCFGIGPKWDACAKFHKFEWHDCIMPFVNVDLTCGTYGFQNK